MTANEYRQHAAECLRMVEQVSHTKSKLALIEMAEGWMRLADQAEKNSHCDLVYVTPSRRSPPMR